MSYLFNWACLLINLLVFLTVGMNCSWRMLSLKTYQLSLAPTYFKVPSSHGYPPISSLKKPNVALLISVVFSCLLTCHLFHPQGLELYYFMVTMANTAHYHIPDYFFLACEQQIQLCIAPCWPLQYWCQEFIPDTFQRPAGLLLSHCVALPEDTRESKALLSPSPAPKSQDLLSRDFLGCLKASSAFFSS